MTRDLNMIADTFSLKLCEHYALSLLRIQQLNMSKFKS